MIASFSPVYHKEFCYASKITRWVQDKKVVRRVGLPSAAKVVIIGG
jgi:hypothetical protein